MLQNLKVINLQNLAYSELSSMPNISTAKWCDYDCWVKRHENALQNLAYDWQAGVNGELS